MDMHAIYVKDKVIVLQGREAEEETTEQTGIGPYVRAIPHLVYSFVVYRCEIIYCR